MKVTLDPSEYGDVRFTPTHPDYDQRTAEALLHPLYQEATTVLVHTDRDKPPVLSAWHAVGELVRRAVATTPDEVETATGTRFSVAEVFAAAGTLQRRRHGAADPGTALVRGTEMFSSVAYTLVAGTPADARHAALHDNEAPTEERYTVSEETLYLETPEAE